MAYSIELDCPPGSPRPGDLFPIVIEDTGLSEEDFSEPSMLFGNWCWVLNEDPKKEQIFQNMREVIKERVVGLYNEGAIRYGSW
jgi:hypothetical protein